MTTMTREILDRLRRIETKLSRFLAGEPDQPTKTTCEAWSTAEGWEIEVNSMGVSLQTILDAAANAGATGQILVCDNGKPRLMVEVLK